MARFAIIEGGATVNIIEADAAFAQSIGAVPAGTASIGDLYAAGVFSKPPPPPPVIPQTVTMRQARLALMAAGLLTTVNSTIAGMGGTQGEAARIEWEFSSEVKRNQPLVLALGPTLGLTSEQLDSLFVTAAALN